MSSQADPSLFVLKTDGVLIILLLYVDDMLVTGLIRLRQFLAELKSEFSMKDLGSVHYFLGIQIQSTDIELFLSQERYAQKLLQKMGMLDCKPLSSPMVNKDVTKLTFADPTQYRAIVGSL